MEFWKLFVVALMPVLKVLFITALGTILAINRFNILGETARKNLNTVSSIIFFLNFFLFSIFYIYSKLASHYSLFYSYFFYVVSFLKVSNLFIFFFNLLVTLHIVLKAHMISLNFQIKIHDKQTSFKYSNYITITLVKKINTLEYINYILNSWHIITLCVIFNYLYLKK